MEQLFGELKKERSNQPFIEVKGGLLAKPQNIQPSRVVEQTTDILENQVLMKITYLVLID